MFPRTIELAFARFQARRDPKALAIVFDRTAPELLRVARHLASAEASAEDLLQATFLQAIESATDHRRGEPVLPWLIGILANQARSARRKARRRVDVARLRSEAVADVQAEVERHELGATVATAIAQLPEAYRPVLRMWLEHGLEAKAIAATLERPPGTVRAQISRGLDLLRKALPASVATGVAVTVAAGRGLAAVRREVLGVGAGASTGLVATLAFGGIVVLQHKLFAAGAALAFALLTWSMLSGAPPEVPVLADGANRADLAAATGTGSGPDDPRAVAARVPVAAPASTAPASAPPRHAAPTTGELVVELVSAVDGSPLSGIGVAVQRGDDRDTFARYSQWLPTDAQGVVRFPDLRPATWHIDLDRLGAIAAGEVVAGTSVHRRVEVPAGIRVQGAVVDEADRPVVGAEIVVHGSRLAAPRVATSDALGRFTVDRLVPKLYLQARRAGYEASLVHLVEGVEGAQVELTLRVHNGGRRVGGRVVGDRGQGLANATVAIVDAEAVHVDFWDPSAAQRRPCYCMADRDGAFTCDECGARRLLVLAMPAGGDDAPCWEFVAAGAEPAFVALRAPRAAVVAGRFGGVETATEIAVQAFARDTESLGFLANLAALRCATVAADGRFRLDGLLGGRVDIVARRLFETVASTERTLAAGAEQRWDVDLADQAQSGQLQVRVRASAPLPRSTVVLVGPHVPDNSAPAMQPLDADGAAQVARTGVGTVDVSVCVLVGNRTYLQLASRADVPLAVTTVEIELAADQLPGRRVTGRLVDATGAPVANTQVTALRSDATGLQARDLTSTDGDGRFATVALPAGTYRIATGGPQAMARLLGTAVLTVARDEDLGDLRVLQ